MRALILSTCLLAAMIVAARGAPITVTEVKLQKGADDAWPFGEAELNIKCFNDTAASNMIFEREIEEVDQTDRLYTGDWPLGDWNESMGAVLYCRFDELDAIDDDFFGDTILNISDFTTANEGDVAYAAYIRTDDTDDTGAFPATVEFKVSCPECVGQEYPVDASWESDLVAWPTDVRGECLQSGPLAIQILRQGLCCQLLGASASQLGDGECDEELNTGFCLGDFGDCAATPEGQADSEDGTAGEDARRMLRQLGRVTQAAKAEIDAALAGSE